MVFLGILFVERRVDTDYCNLFESFLFNDLGLLKDLFVFNWSNLGTVNLNSARYDGVVAIDDLPQLARGCLY